MLSGFALLGVVLAGVYFLGLAALVFIAPVLARRFLLGFAGSAAVHYFELLIRLAVGGAFVLRAPLMMFPQAFSLVGWVLLVTSGCLLALPWRWHRRFAQQAVPFALRQIGLVGTASLVLGAVVLVSAALGPPA